MVESVILTTKIYSNDGNLEGNFGYDDAQWLVSTALTGSSQWTVSSYRNTGLYLPFFVDGQDDFSQIIIQMPHKKKFGELKSLHVHGIPIGNGSGDIYWSVQYHWFNVGQELPILSNWAAGTTPIYTKQRIESNDQYIHKVHTLLSDITFPSLPEIQETASSIFVAKIVRKGTDNDNDTYTSNFGLLYFDIHYEIDKSGTPNEFY